MTGRALAATRRLWAVLLVSAASLACSTPGPGVISYDSDACDHCRMTISDPRFAAQLVTRTGKIYRFDDPGCLASFVASHQVPPDAVHSVWMNDYAHPEHRLQAEAAVFVASDRIRAPMNGGIAAFASRADALALQTTVGGRLARWADVVTRRPS